MKNEQMKKSAEVADMAQEMKMTLLSFLKEEIVGVAEEIKEGIIFHFPFGKRVEISIKNL